MTNGIALLLSMTLAISTQFGCLESDTGSKDVFDSVPLGVANRKNFELGRCRGGSRVQVSALATLTHASNGTPPVKLGEVLTLKNDQGAGSASLVVGRVDSGWVSPNWNIFSAAGTFTDSRRGTSQQGTFDLVVGPGVGVLLMKTNDGQPWDFYRMTCDTTDAPLEAGEPPVATRWTLQSRADDRFVSLTSEVMLPGPGDELALAFDGEQNQERRAQLSVTTSAAFPFASFVSGTFVDTRKATQRTGSFDLVVGTDINVLLMKTTGNKTWDFFGGDAEPEARTEIANGGVARCVVVTTQGDFSSSHPPRRGDRLTLDLEDPAMTSAVRFNGEGAADPVIPLNGPLHHVAQPDGAGFRLESPDPGRVGLGIGIDIFNHGAGQLSTMWLSQNLLSSVLPAQVSLALLRCGGEAFQTVPELPPTAQNDPCLVVSADGVFSKLSAHDVRLNQGDALATPPGQLSKLDGTKTLTFLTRATGAEPIGFTAPLDLRTTDKSGLRFFSSSVDGGTHLDLFGGSSLWFYHNVGVQHPLANGTWALLTCPSNQSCKDRCDGQSSDKTCWCDTQCAEFGDCCADIQTQCGPR